MYLYFDCETRNELDITDVGAYKYTSHPSCEILMVAYAYGDEPVKLWECLKEKIPDDLDEGLRNDAQVLVAWNGPGFDRLAFRKQLGIDISVDRFVDPMVLSRYMSMPGKQEKVGKILDIENKKLIETAGKDDTIISFFCEPLRKGGEITLFGTEPTTYRDWTTHPREWERLRARCMVDVEGMREIHHRLSKYPLPDFEYELFALNEKINDFGIYIDPVLLQGTMLVVDKEFEHLKKEFFELTGITKPKSPKQVLAYARNHGYTFQSVNKTFVNRALAGECDLTEDCKKALKLRMQLGKSSVTKLEAIKDAVEDDGRVRGLFNFMGAARTGRWTSGMVQVQNLAKATKEVEKKYDLALQLLKAGDYEGIRQNFSSTIDVACAAIRPVFRAPKGKKFIISDLSAIETRGSAWVAGCEPLLEVFRKGLDPYIAFAAQMDPSKTYEQLWAEYKVGDKTTRTNAKPPTLGCFGKHTLVVTSKGLKHITKIRPEDELWDGEEWVKSEGVIHQGYKETIDMLGVSVTQDHEVLVEDGGWKEAWELADTQYANRAICLASGSFKKESFEKSEVEKNSITSVNALAEKRNGYTELILKQVNRIVAMGVLENEQSRKETEFIKDLMLLERSLIDLRTDIMQSYPDAGVSEALLTAIRDAGLSVNSEMSTISWSTVCLFQITISLAIKLIEQIITGIMKKEISGLSLAQSMGEIKKYLGLSNTEEKNYLPWNFTSDIARYTERLRLCVEKLEGDFLPSRLLQISHGAVEPTYDIKSSGPRNRYTIVTKNGPMIVHNCGYGLTPGMISKDDDGNIVKTGLLGYASAMGIELDPVYAEQAVKVYRTSYHEIQQFWYDLHAVFRDVVKFGEIGEIGPLTLEKSGRVLNLWLPSGRALHYINPRVREVERLSTRTGKLYKTTEFLVEGVDQKTHQWGDIVTHGSKIFENVVQAICRDILGYGMIEADKRGFPIVLTCHDEIVAEVDEDSDLTYKDLESIMSQDLKWCPGFMIGAAGFETTYYRKE